mmetsp:Transcript_29089/g.34301  ORF Transcript_29089/g.34301 Transcript_29089/m.34301 type:complete len:410 (-) Transcript_29089:208-1437(-)
MSNSSHLSKRSARDTFSYRHFIRRASVVLLAQSASAQFSNYGNSDGHRPIALHQLIPVSPGGDELVALRGYDADGDNLKATVKSLPGGSGSVHQLSKVYSDFGYEPKKGVTIMNGQDVTGSKGNRVYYKRPSVDQTQVGSWGIMKYTVSDLSDSNQVKSESYEGMITFVPPSGILVGSHFTRGHEDWTIIGNKVNGYNVNYEASSRGSLNHYIYASDDTINNDALNNNDDLNLWYFNAPNKFLGHLGVSYGGTLEFILSSFHGDFSKSKLNIGNIKYAQGLHLIEIHCAKCNTNRGVTIAFPLKKTKSFSGAATKYSITLKENSGWIQDPKNTLKTWFTPTQCTMIEVLSGISSLKILGDFTKWYESVALDTVQIVNLKSKIPVCAQLTPDASTCTCSPDAYSNTVIPN